MINSFRNYLDEGKVKRKTPDYIEAKALLESAGERLSFAKSIKITRQNANFILEAAYEASRETAQSFMSAKGYKPYSHEATISFVKDFLKEFNQDEIAEFDRFRQIRNDSIYKAVKVSEKDAADRLSFSEKFIKKGRSIREQNR